MSFLTRNFEFVTHTGPDDERAAANRHTVRSYALRHYHKHRIHHRPKKNEIELDVSHLLDKRFDGTAGTLTVEKDDSVIGTFDRVIGFPENRAAVDPFFHYPIDMGVRERALYYHRTPMLFFLENSANKVLQSTTSPVQCFARCGTWVS